MATAVGWAPIIKSEKTADGTLRVTGKAADSSVDRDYQIADEAWLDKAMGAWYSEVDGGNIREQHDGKRAVGTAVEYRKGDDGGHYITAEIVDPLTIAKIDKRVLKGFSWSARNARVTVDKAAAGGRIVDGQIYEVSVVDRPANPACQFTIAKADGPDGDGELELVDAPEFVELDKADVQDVGVIEKTELRTGTLTLNEARAKFGHAPQGDEPTFTPTQFASLLKALGKTPDAPAVAPVPVEKTDDAQPMTIDVKGGSLTEATIVDALQKRDFSDEKRTELADKGHALPDGSYPIENKGDLKNAIKAFGRAKDPAAAKKHIIKRARALDAVDALPDDWNVSKADGVLAQVRAMVPGLDIAKDDGEAGDITAGMSAITAIARLIISEAESLAAGNMNEIWDIRTLLDAACALQCFVDSETWEDYSMTETKAETAKADDATEAVAETETTTAAPEAADTTEKTEASPEETLTKTDLTDLLESTIAKVSKPYEERIAALEGQLAKVLETPRTDGPARTRTTTQAAVASKADDLRAELAHCEQQIRLTGGELQKGYRQRRDLAEIELRKLDGES